MRAPRPDPYPCLEAVQQRIAALQAAVTAADAQPENEFQELAFGQPTLAFINAARRELDWRRSRRDHTVAAFLHRRTAWRYAKGIP